jgi:hypothetical protein
MRTKQPDAVVSMELRVSRASFESEMRAWAAGWPAFTEDYRAFLFDLFVKRLSALYAAEDVMRAQSEIALRDVIDGLDAANNRKAEA